MNHSELAHRWANNRFDSYKTSSNMFVDNGGKSIYSYGYHFEIARHFNHEIVLLTSKTYSNSTAKQTNHVVNSIHYKKVFTVVKFFNQGDSSTVKNIAHKENINRYYDCYANAIKRVKRARELKSFYINECRRYKNLIIEYIEVFKVPKKCILKKVQTLISKPIDIEIESKQFLELERKRKEKEDIKLNFGKVTQIKPPHILQIPRGLHIYV